MSAFVCERVLLFEFEIFFFRLFCVHHILLSFTYKNLVRISNITLWHLFDKNFYRQKKKQCAQLISTHTHFIFDLYCALHLLKKKFFLSPYFRCCSFSVFSHWIRVHKHLRVKQKKKLSVKARKIKSVCIHALMILS